MKDDERGEVKAAQEPVDARAMRPWSHATQSSTSHVGTDGVGFGWSHTYVDLLG
jgi:hypothetical protein